MPISMIDNTAVTVLPKGDTKDGIAPIYITEDGNCLFNAISLAICQSENLADELRLRAALELLTNPDFYGSHPVITSMLIPTQKGKTWSKEAIYDAVIFCNRAADIHAKEGFQQALEQEICNTLYNSRELRNGSKTRS